MVSDVTRMGEWSPVCKACWWDDGDSPRVGAWFTGRNELPERTWETRSEVVAAEDTTVTDEDLQERFGPDAQAQIANRAEAAHTGIPVTLAAIKRIAEAG